MKKSDMKLISVLLAMALFVTVVFGNAVTITAVVMLAGNGISAITSSGSDSQEQPVVNNTITTPTNNPDSLPGVPSSPSGTTQTPSQNISNTPTGDTGSSSAGNGGVSQSTGAIDKEALKMFQDAANEIKTNGSAGYSKKNWQTVAAPLKLDQLASLSDTLSGIIENFMVSEADAKVLVSEKGTEDAKNRMPACNATEATIQSVTKQESGDNVIITIVMKDSYNPGLDDTDGVTVMSHDLLYIEYVTNEIENNSLVNFLVKELTRGDITYKAFTITATMTKDGKFVEIVHDGDSYIDAAAQTTFGEVSGSGGIGFHAKFYDFKY